MKLINKNRYIAHVKKHQDDVNWLEPHDLAKHCQEVGDLAAIFAKDFGSQWARMAGYWHDLGKYREKFQEYIRNASGFEREQAHIESSVRVTHSTAGAIYAIKKIPQMGDILAYIIAVILPRKSGHFKKGVKSFLFA